VDTPTLGQPVRLVLDVGGHQRVACGMIGALRRGVLLAGGQRIVRCKVVPALARLRGRRTSRIFQDVSTVDIVVGVLRDHGVSVAAPANRPGLRQGDVVREYCVQHEETDYDFVTRLLAEEGIAFRFDQPEADAAWSSAETLVLFDSAAGYRDLAGGAHLSFRSRDEADALSRRETDVDRFSDEERVRPDAALLREYDLGHPLRTVVDRAPGERVVTEAVGLATVFEHHGPFGEHQVEPTDAARALEQIRRDARRQRGSSTCARLTAGSRIQLDDHPDPACSGQFAVVAVEHRGNGLSADATYENDFVTVPASLVWRPPRPRRRVRQSLETAIVTGPPGEEIHTDALGRVKVRFHWDLNPRVDGETSCWVRVAQSWAGAGWGTQFIPRIGMEVLVAFLGGDPDRPIVVGALPNATHPPPFPLPENKTRSGFRSRSTLEGEVPGHNELSFDDDAGRERIQIVAQRDFDVTVANDQRVRVGGDHSLACSGSSFTTVAGDAQQIVEGATTVRVSGDAASQVSGSRTESVSGDSETTVGGVLRETIDGSRESVIAGETRLTSHGPIVVRAESSCAVSVGGADTLGELDISVQGNTAYRADGVVTIDAGERLILQCGPSRVELTETGIKLIAPSILLESPAVDLAADGPRLRLTDRAELVADEVRLYGKESSLELDRDAIIKGTKVFLNCGPTPPTVEEGSEQASTKKVSLRLTDQHFEPYAGKRYRLRVGPLRFEGTTSSDGGLEHDVPEDARQGELELWLESYPTGPRKLYALTLSDLPSPDSVPGARTRLANLGYFDGPTDKEDLDPRILAALRAFQSDHQLPPSGELDEATVRALVTRHGY
jgi:type VI secretion system secreted protein VgrG